MKRVQDDQLQTQTPTKRSKTDPLSPEALASLFDGEEDLILEEPPLPDFPKQCSWDAIQTEPRFVDKAFVETGKCQFGHLLQKSTCQIPYFLDCPSCTYFSGFQKCRCRTEYEIRTLFICEDCKMCQRCKSNSIRKDGEYYLYPICEQCSYDVCCDCKKKFILGNGDLSERSGKTQILPQRCPPCREIKEESLKKEQRRLKRKKIYELNVSFDEKEEAKSCGAWWDPSKRSWVVSGDKLWMCTKWRY